MKISRCSQMILLLSALILVNGCSDFTSVVRKVTYPPDFKYVTGAELRSNMDKLAFQLQLLDQALSKTSTGKSAQQQVVTALRNMERIGSSLQAGDTGTNHPFLQDFMRDFVNDVERARTAAAMEPPYYYYAGRIAGGCVNCHAVNR